MFWKNSANRNEFAILISGNLTDDKFQHLIDTRLQIVKKLMAEESDETDCKSILDSNVTIRRFTEADQTDLDSGKPIPHISFYEFPMEFRKRYEIKFMIGKMLIAECETDSID